jgi:hypothetical protein
MTNRRRIGTLVVGAILGIASAELGAWLSLDAVSGYVSSAQAYTDRNMSPVTITHAAQTGLWGGCDAALMTTC